MMIRHLKRESVAAVAIAFVILAAYYVFQQTSDLRLAASVGGLLAVCFLHAHLAQLARDQSARLTSPRA
jgi:hypothetical protein